MAVGLKLTFLLFSQGYLLLCESLKKSSNKGSSLFFVSTIAHVIPDFDTLKYVILQYTDCHYFINFKTPKWVSQLKKGVYLHHVRAQEK